HCPRWAQLGASSHQEEGASLTGARQRRLCPLLRLITREYRKRFVDLGRCVRQTSVRAVATSSLVLFRFQESFGLHLAPGQASWSVEQIDPRHLGRRALREDHRPYLLARKEARNAAQGTVWCRDSHIPTWSSERR